MYSVSKLMDLVHQNHLDDVVKNNMCSNSEFMDLAHQNHLDDTVKKICESEKNNTCFTPEFMGWVHQNYLDSIIKKICESGKMSLSIELEEDLSQEDLEYIKKGVETWYERYL